MKYHGNISRHRVVELPLSAELNSKEIFYLISIFVYETLSSSPSITLSDNQINPNIPPSSDQCHLSAE